MDMLEPHAACFCCPLFLTELILLMFCSGPFQVLICLPPLSNSALGKGFFCLLTHMSLDLSQQKNMLRIPDARSGPCVWSQPADGTSCPQRAPPRHCLAIYVPSPVQTWRKQLCQSRDISESQSGDHYAQLNMGSYRNAIPKLGW